ncbi:kinase-like domain-containing protein [Diaporthe sp. PMI_573]|nr:kinase-like domain-containing protein [Diaporthaceae sp. PMI_573]
MPREIQDGLEWEDNLFSLIPRWTREPSVEAIEGVCRRQLEVPAGSPCTASFYAAGAFNKLYLIACADESFLMRVTLPVNPYYKTRGEVATLCWVREHTNIPVPKVIAFEDNNDNTIGFEWILMELMSGTTAYQQWRTMTLEQKSAIAKSIAEFQVQSSCYGNSPFTNIGTLDLENGPPRVKAPTKVTLGKIVSHEFFMGNRIKYDVPRGPFRSSLDWLTSEIRLIMLEQTEALDKAEDDDDREDAEEILNVARKLLSVFPKVFPNDDDQEDEIATALYHDDLSLHNILVNKEGEITAIVDWECVSAMPIWLTTKMPKFLIGESREEEPIQDVYADEIPGESGDPQNDGGPGNLDNEGKNQLYWIHLMEYETTQLRAVYERRLRELWPAWPLQGSQIKVDLVDAVLQCSAGIFVKKVDRWADSIERGELVRWADA